MLPRVLGGPVSNGLIVTLEVFRKDIGIQKNFDHLKRRAAGTPSFLVGQFNDLIQQRGIFRATKQAETLFEDRRFPIGLTVLGGVA